MGFAWRVILELLLVRPFFHILFWLFESKMKLENCVFYKSKKDGIHTVQYFIASSIILSEQTIFQRRQIYSLAYAFWR